MRPGDAAGRMGGDEFVVVCEGADADVADDIARRVQAAIAEPLEPSVGGWAQVTASTGAAVAGVPGTPAGA